MSSFAMRCPVWIIMFAVSFSGNASAGSQLLATGGVTQVEGSAGGGLVPWAVIAGYGDANEYSSGAFTTQVDLADFRLHSVGAYASWDNRWELSASQQRFTVKQTDVVLRQEVYGVKARLAGDVLYGPGPQWSLGVQYKRLLDDAVAQSLSADKTHADLDVYLAASQIHLAAFAGYNMMWNATLRASRANQLGFLGYGGDEQQRHQLLLEASALMLVRPDLAIGVEYRQKPDNLSAIKEDDWYDVFVAWFPNKHVSVTAAWAHTGRIAGRDKQEGMYWSLATFF